MGGETIDWSGDALVTGCNFNGIPGLTQTSRGLESERLTIAMIDGHLVVRMTELFVYGHDPVAALQAQLDEARRERDELRISLNTLFGARFSDRCYYALKSRAEKAEADLATLRELAAEMIEKREGLAYEDELLRRVRALLGVEVKG